MCGLLSLHDQQCIMGAGDDGAQWPRGPWPPGSPREGRALVWGVSRERPAWRSPPGGARGAERPGAPPALGGRPRQRPARASLRRPAPPAPSGTSRRSTTGAPRSIAAGRGGPGPGSSHGRWGARRATRAARQPPHAPRWPPTPLHRQGPRPLHDLLSKICGKTISIPRTCILCFMGLASCGSMGSRIVNPLWFIEVDPHRGGSISLRPCARVSLGTVARTLEVTTVRRIPARHSCAA
jgi:hypothetical protein